MYRGSLSDTTQGKDGPVRRTKSPGQRKTGDAYPFCHMLAVVPAVKIGLVFVRDVGPYEELGGTRVGVVIEGSAQTDSPVWIKGCTPPFQCADVTNSLDS